MRDNWGARPPAPLLFTPHCMERYLAKVSLLKLLNLYTVRSIRWLFSSSFWIHLPKQ